MCFTPAAWLGKTCNCLFTLLANQPITRQQLNTYRHVNVMKSVLYFLCNITFVSCFFSLGEDWGGGDPFYLHQVNRWSWYFRVYLCGQTIHTCYIVHAIDSVLITLCTFFFFSCSAPFSLDWHLQDMVSPSWTGSVWRTWQSQLPKTWISSCSILSCFTSMPDVRNWYSCFALPLVTGAHIAFIVFIHFVFTSCQLRHARIFQYIFKLINHSN